MQRPEDDLKRRRPIWEAMHAIWLDTEIGDDGLRSIARVCAGSDYDIHTLGHIYWQEIYPAMRWNLWSVAGEWRPLEIDGLTEKILETSSHNRQVRFKRLRRYAYTTWCQLEDLITAERMQ